MQQLVHTDQRIIAEELGLSKERVCQILTNNLEICFTKTKHWLTMWYWCGNFGAKLILLLEHSQFGSTQLLFIPIYKNFTEMHEF
jgi:hypothetical protein